MKMSRHKNFCLQHHFSTISKPKCGEIQKYIRKISFKFACCIFPCHFYIYVSGFFYSNKDRTICYFSGLFLFFAKRTQYSICCKTNLPPFFFGNNFWRILGIFSSENTMYKCTWVSFHIEYAFARKQLSFWNVFLVRIKRIKRVPLCITTTNKSFLKKLFPLAHTLFRLFCILYIISFWVTGIL